MTVRSTDWAFSKNKHQLGQHFTASTMLLLRQYKSKGAVEVSIDIPAATSIQGGLLTLRIRMPRVVGSSKSKGKLMVLRLGRTKIEERGVESELVNTGRPGGGIVLANLSVMANGMEVRGASHSSAATYLEVFVPTDELPPEPCDLTVQLSTPNIYYTLNEREPFVRSVIDLSLEIPGANLILLDLTFPSNYGLRGRIDNAEYLSFPLTSVNDKLVYYYFFHGPLVSTRCFLGDSDPNRLSAPALPLVSVGVGLIALGYSLLLLANQRGEIASAVYALSLVTSLYQFIFRRRSFWPDPDLAQGSYNSILATIAIACYIPLLVVSSLSILVLIPQTGLEVGMAGIDIGVGIILCIGFILYSLLLHIGFLQHFVCDFREHRLWNRRRTLLHIPTRKSVCQAHFEELMAMSAAQDISNKSNTAS